jgi:phosphohistidine phosphatase
VPDARCAIGPKIAPAGSLRSGSTARSAKSAPTGTTAARPRTKRDSGAAFWDAVRVAAAGRTLVLVRHAKSAWPPGVADPRRPLADRGRRDAPAIGRWLREHVGQLDLVVCSPATRARQTWDLAAAELHPAPRVRHQRRVYAAPADDLLEVVRELPGRAAAAALVGHNPGLQDLAELLSGQPCELKTAAVAVLRWSGSWADAGPEAAVLEEWAKPRG